MKSRRPTSLNDVVEIATGSHSLQSDPPVTRWLDRRVGKLVRQLFGSKWSLVTVSHVLGMGHAWAWLRWLHWLR